MSTAEVAGLPEGLGYWPDPAEVAALQAAAENAAAPRAARASEILEHAAWYRRQADALKVAAAQLAAFTEDAARLFLRSDQMSASLAVADDADTLGDVATIGETAETLAQQARAARDRCAQRRAELLDEAEACESEAAELA